jgi:ATP synthase protein I
MELAGLAAGVRGRDSMNKSTRDAVQLLAVASSMGIAMVLATVIGLTAGYYLDKWFGTSPWLTIVFLILGIIAGFKNIYVITRRVQRMAKEDQ